MSDISEQAFLFGGHGGLVGIIARPEGPVGTTVPGVLLLNAGLVHRVGPNRLYVKLARHFAGLGLPTLRFDLSGIGDSDIRPDLKRFRECAMADTREAIDLLVKELGIQRVILVGVCSGAEVALAAACVDTRVSGLALMNLQNTHHGATEGVRQELRIRANLRYYVSQALFQPHSWLRLLKADSDYRGMFNAVFNRFRTIRVRRTGTINIAEPLLTDFRSFAGRGGRTLLAFSSRDSGLDYLRLALGHRLKELVSDQHVTFRKIRGADHTFTDNQDEIMSVMTDWLSERQFRDESRRP